MLRLPLFLSLLAFLHRVKNSDGQSCSATTDFSGEVLVQGGVIVNEDGEQRADVLIADGKIVRVASEIPAESAGRVVDATGKFVFPGGIDPHTHLAMPFMGTVSIDDFESGHRAALAGGTTMHVDFVLPVEGSLVKGVKEWEKKAEKSKMDYMFHMAVTGWKDQISSEMETVVREYGINSFKFFLAYKGALMVSDDQFVKALRRCKELGALAQVHAENGDAVAEGQEEMIRLGVTQPHGHALSRPAELEEEATNRAIMLARFVNTPLYVVHVMCKGAMEAVARARQAGQRVIGEPTIAGMALDESLLWNSNFTEAAKFVMSPPIRSLERDGLFLRDALRNDVLSLIATDHATFNSEQKAKGKDDFRMIPNGVNGLEERIPVAWELMVNSGKLSRPQFARAVSTAAAKIFNVYPQKGAIREGSDADLFIIDPKEKFRISKNTHHSNLDTNVFEGFEGTGAVTVTISQGRVVWEGGKLHLDGVEGRYVRGDPFAPFLFSGIDNEEKRKALKREVPKASPTVVASA